MRSHYVKTILLNSRCHFFNIQSNQIFLLIEELLHSSLRSTFSIVRVLLFLLLLLFLFLSFICLYMKNRGGEGKKEAYMRVTEEKTSILFLFLDLFIVIILYCGRRCFSYSSVQSDKYK